MLNILRVHTLEFNSWIDCPGMLKRKEAFWKLGKMDKVKWNGCDSEDDCSSLKKLEQSQGTWRGTVNHVTRGRTKLEKGLRFELELLCGSHGFQPGISSARIDGRMNRATGRGCHRPRISWCIASPFSAYLNDTIVLYERSDIGSFESERIAADVGCRSQCLGLRGPSTWRNHRIFESFAKFFSLISFLSDVRHILSIIDFFVFICRISRYQHRTLFLLLSHVDRFSDIFYRSLPQIFKRASQDGYGF